MLTQIKNKLKKHRMQRHKKNISSSSSSSLGRLQTTKDKDTSPKEDSIFYIEFYESSNESKLTEY